MKSKYAAGLRLAAGPAVLTQIALLAVLGSWAWLAGCSKTSENAAGTSGELSFVDDIDQRVEQFVPQSLSADLSILSDGDRQALDRLIQASRILNDVFKMQAWQNRGELDARVAQYDGPHAKSVKRYYAIMYGPWDRLDSMKPWLGDEPHPTGAGFYPEDMTKEEFEAWIAAHPDQEASFTGLHSVIRRKDGELIAIPYSDAYGIQLRQVADLLRQAAGLSTDESLKHFLELRAGALLADDYFESDMAWMDLSGDLEVVIGPYETYEDGLFGYKASFESFLCLVNPRDSAALDKYKSELPWLERNLPIADEYKNLNRGTESPIRVADEVYTGGDTRAGVQTLAFNLPNDERVREAKGSKKVMLKNVIRAKYDAILMPIARRVLAEHDVEKVDFTAYFDFILHHELSHGLGPGRVVIDGRETEVRLVLKDLYSALEEAKADVLGIYNLYALVDKGVLSASEVENLSWTVVPGLFRSARFGVTEAHGLGVVCQFNYLLEKGALVVSPDGKFRPIEDNWRVGIRDLAHDLLMLQANCDYDAAKRWVEKYGGVSPSMQKALDALQDVPVDIVAEFAVERPES